MHYTDTGGASELRTQGETLPDKPLAHIPPVGGGAHQLQSRRRWPSEPLQQRVQHCEICALRSAIPLKVRFGTDSAMTPR
jgi:hypothetical protein